MIIEKLSNFNKQNIENFLKELFLFISSYTPLFLILSLKYYKDLYFIVCLILLVLINGYVLKFIKDISERFFIERKIISVENKTSNILSYLIVFSISVLNFNLNIWQGRIQLLIILFIIFVVFVRSDLLFLNPTLAIFGYRSYSIKFANGDHVFVLSKNKVKENTVIKVNQIIQGFYAVVLDNEKGK